MTELGWSASFPQVVNSPLTFLARYVDNRLVIAPRDVHLTLPFQVFSHETFYGHPIMLEPVGNGQFLGFDTDVSKRTITYLRPQHSWQVRHPMSAGSDRLLASGAKSRISLIRKHTWPSHHAREAVRAFVQWLANFGYPAAVCDILIKC